jgi:outer membrane protein assembly factor BamA
VKFRWLAASLCVLATSRVRAEEALDPERLEPAVLPVVTASTDFGIGVGALGSLARFSDGYTPYRWRLQLLTFASGKTDDEGAFGFPYQDHQLEADFPELGRGLRFAIRARFTRNAAAPYYGIGNASLDLGAGRVQQYDRIYPSLVPTLRVTLSPVLFAFAQVDTSFSSLDVYEGSRLERDLAGASGETVRDTLRGTGDHWLAVTTAGVAIDTRDDETSPTRGLFHEASLRAGHAFGSEASFRGANVNARYFVPIHGDTLVLATRFLLDVLWGEPPFYLLSRVSGLDSFNAPGGESGVRGVPVGRYAGDVKVVGNLELRSVLLRPSIGSQRFEIGPVAFFDTGRVWTALDPTPDLDGTDLGLKYGAGGGLRLQWGEAFLIRIDAARSPDGTGFYFGVNHAF